MKTLSAGLSKLVACAVAMFSIAFAGTVFAQDCPKPPTTVYVVELKAPAGQFLKLKDTSSGDPVSDFTKLLNSIDATGANGSCVLIKTGKGPELTGPPFNDVQNSSSIAAKKAAAAAGSTPRPDGGVHVTQTSTTETVTSVHVTQRVASNKAEDLKRVLDSFEPTQSAASKSSAK